MLKTNQGNLLIFSSFTLNEVVLMYLVSNLNFKVVFLSNVSAAVAELSAANTKLAALSACRIKSSS